MQNILLFFESQHNQQTLKPYYLFTSSITHMNLVSVLDWVITFYNRDIQLTIVIPTMNI